MAIIYSDLNCPFCFAQHERIASSKLSDQFSWRFVEHAPSFNSRGMSSQQKALLDKEVALAQQRAPDITIRHPGFSVSSHLPILSLISVELSDPDKVTEYRTLIYRAYWQEGRDISDILVIQDLLQHLNISTLNIHTSAEEIQHGWQTLWELGDFDLRIPSIESSSGQIMLGLQHIFNIQNYLQSDQATPVDSGQYCDRQRQVVIAAINLASLADNLPKQVAGYSVTNFQNSDEMVQQTSLAETDAVLIHYQSDSNMDHAAIRAVKEAIADVREIPIFYIAQQYHASDEVKAFALGACDYVVIDQEFSPLIARLNARIGLYQSVATLRQHATVDGLTGLLNKREFHRVLEREWRTACRTDNTLAVVMVDIDHFKKYNDFYGHCAGDECLKQVAAEIQQCVMRPGDCSARFGGEEFVILLPDTSEQGVISVAERLQQQIAKLAIRHEKNPDNDQVTLSIGICTATPHTDQTPLDFIELADRALYESKNNGRNRISLRKMERPDYI